MSMIAGMAFFTADRLTKNFGRTLPATGLGVVDTGSGKGKSALRWSGYGKAVPKRFDTIKRIRSKSLG
jgi:hypothetical protein